MYSAAKWVQPSAHPRVAVQPDTQNRARALGSDWDKDIPFTSLSSSSSPNKIVHTPVTWHNPDSGWAQLPSALPLLSPGCRRSSLAACVQDTPRLRPHWALRPWWLCYPCPHTSLPGPPLSFRDTPSLPTRHLSAAFLPVHRTLSHSA